MDGAFAKSVHCLTSKQHWQLGAGEEKDFHRESHQGCDGRTAMKRAREFLRRWEGSAEALLWLFFPFVGVRRLSLVAEEEAYPPGIF